MPAGRRTLERPILRLKSFQPLRVGDLYPAKPDLPRVQRRWQHAVLAAKLGNANPRFMFLQYPDDLLFEKRDRFVRPVLSSRPDSSITWRNYQGSQHRPFGPAPEKWSTVMFRKAEDHRWRTNDTSQRKLFRSFGKLRFLLGRERHV